MALIKCNECGHTISDKAESCPNCGYPVRLLMEQQQEKTEKSVKTHFTAGTEEKKKQSMKIFSLDRRTVKKAF